MVELQSIQVVKLGSHCGAQSRFAIKTLLKRAIELVLSFYYCSVMSKAGQMKQAKLVRAFLTQASVLLYYITKTRAQCPVHISINGRLRYNYGSDTRNMVATISNSSFSVESTSVNNPEKTGRVQKTFKRKR